MFSRTLQIWCKRTVNRGTDTSFLQDSGKRSFHSFLNCLSPIADITDGALASRYVSPTHLIHVVLSTLTPMRTPEASSVLKMIAGS